MSSFPPALPHGPLTEVFPDVFVVTGGFRFAPAISITRNMTIVRQGGELVLINSVRLSPEGEAELDKLGKVAHLFRIGAFHGADDPYYVDRYKPTLWAPPGTRHGGGLTTRKELVAAVAPLPGMRVFSFDQAKVPEVGVLLERDGGILVNCDAYQNWTSFEGCSLLGGLVGRFMGFGPAVIGGPWVKSQGPGVRGDFERLVELPFQHLLSGHGMPLRDTAKEGLRRAIAKSFG
jgi:hypothetical protein